jgi:integrase/recombinase XerD
MGIKRKITRASKQELTIPDALEEFLEEQRAYNKSESTIKSYEASVNKWIKYLQEKEYSLNVEDIALEYLLAFQNHFLNQDMKPTTLNHYIRDIRAFVYWTRKRGYAHHTFTIKEVVEQEVIIETYTEEEQQLLIAKPSKKANFVEWRSWTIVNWILATGHRASTVCEIRLGDINYNKYEIMVRKTKTNKAYITPLSRSLATVVKEYVRIFRSNASNDDFLFCNVGNEQLTVNALKHSIRDYNLKRGVNRTSIHAFRHTFAKEWIRNTGDILRLQKLLGHKDLEMTRRYVAMFTEDLKQDFETYNPLDRLKKKASRTHVIRRNGD